jgi:hypothetical protein
MTDIVERLREAAGKNDMWGIHEPLEREAADEIEKLRALLKECGAEWNGPMLNKAADEIERLHALCDNLSRIAISKEAALTDAEWVGYYFGLQRALNMKRLPQEFVAFLDHEMREVESKLPPGTIESWPKENSRARPPEN